MRKSFLFLADGFEEVEALGVVDVLRRGTIEVKTVSISDKKEVTGAHGVPVVADLLLSGRRRGGILDLSGRNAGSQESGRLYGIGANDSETL